MINFLRLFIQKVFFFFFAINSVFRKKLENNYKKVIKQFFTIRYLLAIYNYKSSVILHFDINFQII